MRSRFFLAVLGVAVAATLAGPASTNAQTATALTLSEYCPVFGGIQQYGFIARISGLPPNATYRAVYQAFHADGTSTGVSGSFTAEPSGESGLQANAGATPVELFIVEVSFAGVRVQESLDRPCQSLERFLFGKTTVGAAFAAPDHNDKYASPFGLFRASPVVVTKLRAYLDGNGRTTGSQVLRGLIYRNTSAGPGALVAASSAVTIRAGRPAGWVDFPFSSPLTLAGGVYWLGLHAGDSERVARYAFDLKPGGQRNNDDAFSNGPLNPFGSSDKGRREISIHAVGR